jgi:site-specific recombinase XerD
MGTIRNTLRIDKALKTGKCPIDLIYQVAGQRKFFRTDVKLYPQSWDAETQKAIYLDKKNAKKLLPALNYDLLPTSREIEDANSRLYELSVLITEIETRFKMDRVPFSSQMVIDKLNEQVKATTKKEVKSNVLFEFMEKYLADHKMSREPGSLSVYRALKNHLQNYCKLSGRKVTFENIDYSFFQSFQNYLIDRAGLNNTTVAKQLSTVKTFLNYARKQGVDVSMKYKDFKIKRENLEVIALTNQEFETLFNMDLSGNKRLAQIRDVFCFACATGLRYSDLNQLKPEHIKNEEIKLTVKKTKELLTIPLNSYSKAILRRYQEMVRPLPVISNQNMNYAVKELCKLAEIDEPVEIVRFRGVKREAITYKKYELISVHTGRKTFCTLSLEKGMSAEVVMSISGHKDYKSFKRYVKVTEEYKRVIMEKAWGNEDHIKLKAV